MALIISFLVLNKQLQDMSTSCINTPRGLVFLFKVLWDSIFLLYKNLHGISAYESNPLSSLKFQKSLLWQNTKELPWPAKL